MNYELESLCAIWLLLSVHGIGLLGTWMVRATEQTAWHGLSLIFFFFALGLVGLTGLVCVGLQCHQWLLSAATLSVMAVASTIDCGNVRRNAEDRSTIQAWTP